MTEGKRRLVYAQCQIEWRRKGEKKESLFMRNQSRSLRVEGEYERESVDPILLSFLHSFAVLLFAG